MKILFPFQQHNSNQSNYRIISIDDDDDDDGVQAVDEEKDYQYLCSQDTTDTIYNLNNSRSLSFNSWVLVS